MNTIKAVFFFSKLTRLSRLLNGVTNIFLNKIPISSNSCKKWGYLKWFLNIKPQK